MAKRLFTEDQVKEIKSAPDDGRKELIEKFQNEYGIRLTKTTIYDVQTGKTYKDLYPELNRRPQYRQVRITDEELQERADAVEVETTEDNNVVGDGFNPISSPFLGLEYMRSPKATLNTPDTTGDADDWTPDYEADNEAIEQDITDASNRPIDESWGKDKTEVA